MFWKVAAVLLGLGIGFWFYDDFDPAVLKGKRVLVTGASTGIGEQIAYHYARLGANVFITSRREKALQKVVNKCRELGSADGIYGYFAADMSNLPSTERVIQEAVRRLGGIDILVLNHIVVMPLGDWTGTEGNLTSLKHVMDVNFHAYVHLASHATPELEKSGGSVVVLSSFAGKVAVPFVGVYSASKFALDGFFSSWRQELIIKKSSISITLCIIGLIGTDNAVSKLADFGEDFLLSVMTPAKPSDTALAIIKGGARRDREVYYPYLDVRIPYLLRDWMPQGIEYILRYVSTPTHYR